MRHTTHHATVVAAALLAVWTGGPALAGSPAPSDEPVRYVAMGDSAASAAGVPDQTSLKCLRSNNNYPHLLARHIRPAAFTDVTCSGAKAAQLSDQLAALTPDTTLVTLTIGANDARVVDVLEHCSALGLAHPQGAPCRDHYRRDGHDEVLQRIADAGPTVATAVDEVHRRAPRAHVLVTGYVKFAPTGVLAADGPRDPACRLRETFADGDLAYLDLIERRLDAVLGRAARTHGAVFIDNHPASTGHDICAPDGVRWSEGLVPTRPTSPFHPNALGEQAMAREVYARLHH